MSDFTLGEITFTKTGKQITWERPTLPAGAKYGMPNTAEVIEAPVNPAIQLAISTLQGRQVAPVVVDGVAYYIINTTRGNLAVRV